MKVFEVMGALSKMPAGAEVILSVIYNENENEPADNSNPDLRMISNLSVEMVEDWGNNKVAIIHE